MNRASYCPASDGGVKAGKFSKEKWGMARRVEGEDVLSENMDRANEVDR